MVKFLFLLREKEGWGWDYTGDDSADDGVAFVGSMRI